MITQIVTTAMAGTRRAARQPGALVAVAGFYLVVTLALSAMWRAVTESRGGEIAGYDATSITWYIIVSELAFSVVPQRLIEYTGDDVVNRRIVPELIRPARPVVIRLAHEVGMVLPRLAACAVVGVVFGFAVVGPPPSWSGLTLAIPALLLGAAGSIAAQHAFAAASFWFHETRSAWFLYQKLVFILGGLLIPIDVLPGPLRSVAAALPFAAFAYAPSRLAAGRIDPGWFVVQLGWLVALTIAAVVAFDRGTARLVREGS
ncbi:MAG: ABC-2 family transporter protein [Actinomycetota bacterium]